MTLEAEVPTCSRQVELCRIVNWGSGGCLVILQVLQQARIQLCDIAVVHSLRFPSAQLECPSAPVMSWAVCRTCASCAPLQEEQQGP